MMNTIRIRLPLVVLAVLTAAVLLVGDEILMFKTFGKIREIDCSAGKLRGANAQHVCITEETVVKISKPCTTGSGLLFCKWTYWKQVYTNTRWITTYSESPLIPSVLSNDTTAGIVMERIKFSKEQAGITPDFAFNMEQLLALDKMLAENGHIALDVIPDTNVLLDDFGKIHIVDFNLVPSWTRSYVDNFDKLSLHISPFANIYGSTKLLNWVMPKKEAASLSQIDVAELVVRRLRGSTPR